MNNRQKETFAAAVHDSWARWMLHLFENSQQNPDGSVTIPQELVVRWKRQTQTSYQRLSREEQASDLLEVDRYLQKLEQ